jgi:hypothetical protein
MFGLIDGLDLWPVRSLLSNKVQRLGEKPFTVVQGFTPVAVGDACMALLDEADVLEPLMNAMASDVCQVFRTAKLPRKNGKDMKALAQSLRDIGDIPASDLTW